MALAFASVFGWGVLLSAGTVLQSSLTLGANFLGPLVTDAMMSATTAAGGV